MTSARRPARAAVHWLTAQTVAFGAMAALLGIVANAMFLDTFGSALLPVTYIAIGFAGIVVSGAIARTAQRFDLMGIAVAVLASAAVGIAAAWALAVGLNAAWVSAPLLVLFPILIQLGFVFVGGQAGRLLDIAGIKASLPRIMAGFPIGAVIGGVLGGQLVSLLGRTEDLLLATAIAQTAFAALVWETGRRYPSQLGPQSPATQPVAQSGPNDAEQPGRSIRRLLGSRLVALIIVYQVLSALGSQLADYLVFDRAIAQYPDSADLARFLAGYTAVMNVVSIAFLFAVAGPLLRRFGLRLGITANPLVVTIFAIGMIVVLASSGGASLALLATVSAARIADIALTDGMTRTSINAMYQALPDRARLSVQTTVEGIGVPVAIGISGVLIIVLNALPFALAATIGVTALVCAIWTWAAIVLYRAYGPALSHSLRRWPLLAPITHLEANEEHQAVARRLLSSHDPRSVRIGLDLLTMMSAPALAVELAALADDPRPDVRLTALAALADTGDEQARRRLAVEVRAGADSTDPAIRLRAARALASLDPGDPAAATALLEDEAVAVRCAALDSVHPGDLFAVAPAIAALGDWRLLGAAAGAIGRLGDAVVPSMAQLLDAAGSPAPPSVMRLVGAATTRTPRRDDVLLRHVGHRDRELGAIAIERLAAPGPASDAAAKALDDVLLDDAHHAVRILAALMVIPETGDDVRETDGPVRRALDDELDLVRRRVMANRLARHGSERLGPVIIALDAGGPTGALALEALEILLGPAESSLVHTLLRPDMRVAERLEQLDRLDRMPVPVSDGPKDLAGWLRDLVEDADRRWRSNWLRACAIHAAAAHDLLGRIDLADARSLHDPIVDEELSVFLRRMDTTPTQA